MACILDELKKEITNRITETKGSKSYKSRDKTALSKVSSLADFFNKVQKLEKQVIKEDSTSLNQVNTGNGTPIFDTLPSYAKGQNTKTYAGVGSRETPIEIMLLMNKAAKWLEEKGYTLRSGQAVGADMAFEGQLRHVSKNGKFSVTNTPVNKTPDGQWDFKSGRGIKLSQISRKEIYVSDEVANTLDNHPIAKKIPNKYVIVDPEITSKTKKIAKETHPAGESLNGFALGMHARNTHQIFGPDLNTPVDFVLYFTPDGKSSGTDQALRLAKGKGVPTINMAGKDWRSQLTQALKDAKSVENKSTIEVVQTNGSKKQLNINSYQTGLAYKLTNPTNDKSKGLYEVQPKGLKNSPKGVANVEGWYKANNAKVNGIPEGVEGDKYDLELMTNLITEKFKAHPELLQEVKDNGGYEFLKNSTHQIHTKALGRATRWETKGKNAKSMFIQALSEGYNKALGLQLDRTKEQIEDSQAGKSEKDFTWIEDLVESGVLPNTMSLGYRKKIAKGLMQFGVSRSQASIIVKSFSGNPEYLKRGVIALQKDSTSFSDSIDTLKKYLNEGLSRRDFDRKIEDFINQLEKGPTLLGVKSDQYIDTQRVSLYPNMSFEKMPELIRNFLREDMVTDENENNLWLKINNERVRTEAEALEVMFPDQDINTLKKELQIKLDSNEINGC